jgi:hypothetical protein
MRWVHGLTLLATVGLGCQTVRVGPAPHRTHVAGAVPGSRVVVEAADGRRVVPPSGVAVTQRTERTTCDAPAWPLIVGVALGLATPPIGYGVGQALPRYDDAAVAVPLALGAAAFAGVVGGWVWLDHCDTLERAEGQVLTPAPPSAVVVEHGGYRPERLIVDHRRTQVSVTQTPAWRVVVPQGAIDVYAHPRLDRRLGAKDGHACARAAAERLARSAEHGPGVVILGEPMMAPPERRLELDVDGEAPTCRVSAALEGRPTRTATTACEAEPVCAALGGLVEALAP